MEVSVDEAGIPYYSVKVSGEPLIVRSSMGLEAEEFCLILLRKLCHIETVKCDIVSCPLANSNVVCRTINTFRYLIFYSIQISEVHDKALGSCG